MKALESFGDAEPAVTPPNLLDYSSVKGNWRSLSSDIMYRLCSLPAEQKDAQKHISASLEYVATPPNYPEYFETSPAPAAPPVPGNGS